jgi:hypothetical protein
LYDLFEKIPKGSILLWNVEDEKSLPKRKEMTRLLGTEDFTYYKTHGHHSDYIRKLTRLQNYLNPDSSELRTGYWDCVDTSHFLFTSKEIESNSFFLLKYSSQCLGSYFVEGSDLTYLDQLLRAHAQVRRIADEITSWPGRIESHKEEIIRDGIQDEVIETFQVSNLIELTKGYGSQAIEHALSKLQDWHKLHFWKSKNSKSEADSFH